MIRNNLSILLAERNLKITRVAKDTGISRSTITAIAQNDSKMIQMDTIDILCRYLKITPERFFDFLPLSVEVSTYSKDDEFRINYEKGRLSLIQYTFDIYIDVYFSNSKNTFSLSGEWLGDYDLTELANDGMGFIVELNFDKKEDGVIFDELVTSQMNYSFKKDFKEIVNNSIELEFKSQLEKHFTKTTDFDFLRIVENIVNQSEIISNTLFE